MNGEGRSVLHWMTAISLLEWEGEAVRGSESVGDST